MKEIIVNTLWDKKHCRFHSVQEMVKHYIATEVWYNVKFALLEVVQSNVEYRNYLREKGYQATVERLKSEAPSLMRIPDAFEVIDDWWRKVEKKGGLGNYDIQCYELTDTFVLFGKKIKGLEALMKDRLSPLFVAKIRERYPCFDSSDFLCEDRYFQCYYIRDHKVSDDFLNNKSRRDLQHTVSEDIEISDLPLVYYDGESNVMYVISQR